MRLISIAFVTLAILAAPLLAKLHAAPVLKPGECITESVRDPETGTVIRCGDRRGVRVDFPDGCRPVTKHQRYTSKLSTTWICPHPDSGRP